MITKNDLLGKKPSILFLLIFLLFPFLTRSQSVGINTTGNAPDPSAMLDVSASDKGVLIPRVQLDDATTQAPIASAPVEGLLIYNATGTEPAGYYYWDGSQWVQLLAGNKGINSSLVLNGDILELTDPGGTLTADLSPLIDSTDNDSVVGNEYNTGFSITGDQLDITDGGGTYSVDLSPYADSTDSDSVVGNEYNTSLNLTGGGILELTDGGGTLTEDLSGLGGGGTDLDSLADNELITDFTLNGSLLEVSDSGGTYSVDLSPYMDSTDNDSVIGNEYNTGLNLVGNTLEVTDAGGAYTVDLSTYGDSTDNDSVVGNERINNFAITGSDMLEIDDGGGTYSVDLSPYTDSTDDDADPTNEYNTGLNLSGNTLEVTDAGTSFTVDLSGYDDNTDNDSVIGNEAISSVNLNASNELVIDEAGTVFNQDLSSLLDSSFWDRDKTNGHLYPSNIGDSVGIGMNEPRATLHLKGADVNVSNHTATLKIWEEKDGDSLYVDGDEISGALGGGAGNESHLFIQHETSEGVIMTTGGGAQVGVGSGANNPDANMKMHVHHQDQDVAVKGEGQFGPSNGYLGVQGASNLDGVSTADWSGDEIGVVGISTGASSTDNFGVLGHSNHWGGRFEHESSGKFVQLGGQDTAIRIVDGNEADGYVLTSDAYGNATWEPASGGAASNDSDWYYASTDSSFLKDAGTAADCVLVGSNGSGPFYAYDFAVDNGSGDGTQVGMGSVEYFEDGLNLFQFYGGDFYIDENLEINSSFGDYAMNVATNTKNDNSYFNIVSNDDKDVVIDDLSGDGTVRPAIDQNGYLGTTDSAWHYLYRYNEVNTSLRSKKKDIKEFGEEHYQRAMKDIREMDLAFYRYKGESKTFDKNNPTGYRPTPHIGTFVSEVPDYLKDNRFKGILTDGYASLAMAGVKRLDQRMKELEKEVEERTIEDFGSSELKGSRVRIEFNASFQEKLKAGEGDPVISLTTLGQASDLYVEEKNEEGFIVAQPEGNEGKVRFDWTARARVKLEEEEKEAAPLDQKLEVSESEKRKLKEYLEQLHDRRDERELKEYKERIRKAREKGNVEKAKEMEQRHQQIRSGER